MKLFELKQGKYEDVQDFADKVRKLNGKLIVMGENEAINRLMLKELDKGVFEFFFF